MNEWPQNGLVFILPVFPASRISLSFKLREVLAAGGEKL